MINNRLIADNTIKTPFKGPTYFSVSKKLISFQIDKQIKIKTLHRQTKDIDILLTQTPLSFSLSQMQPWLYVLTPANLLEIYLVEYINGINEGSYKKVGILHNVSIYRQNKSGLVISTLDKTLKVLSFKEIFDKTEVNLNIDCNSLKSLSDLDNSFILTTEYSSDRILVRKSNQASVQNAKQPTTEVIDRVNKSAKYQKYSTLSYLNKILSFYRERYVFQHKDEKQIQIYDIEQSKLVGKFSLQGNIKFSQIRQNLFLIVTSKQANDYFHFFVLNPQPSSTQPLITNRACYQKGKADFIKFYNLPSSEIIPYLDKKKNVEVSDVQLNYITDNTSSLVYILNKAKEKVEVIKLDHSKLLKSPFGQEKVDMIVYSRKSEKEVKQAAREENNQIQRSRVHSSIEVKIGGQSMEEMQKRFVQNLIDIKLKNIQKKFDQLQARVANLEKLIQGINSKIEQNLQKVNRKEIKQKVQQLFENMTPQFEKYFADIFKQVSGVFQQGITYYNLKLAKEAEFHKQALTQVVTETFKFTEEVAEISRKEQSVSEKTEEYLKKILETKKKWIKTTEEVESLAKQAISPVVRSPNAEKPKAEGKVFVRADLNYPNSKKET